MAKSCIDDSVLIIVPTINHAEIVERWLQVYKENSEKHRFNVLVIDSSEDDKTKRICEKYSDYVRWEKFRNYGRNNSLKEMDDKVIYGFLRSETKYIWLTSDARIPNVDYCYDIIKKELDDSVDLIHFFYTVSKMNANYIEKHSERCKLDVFLDNNVVNYYKEDLPDFFLNFFWSISTYGISIVNRASFSECDMNSIQNKYSGLSFLYPAMIFDCLTRKKYIKCKVINHGCFIANKLRKVNTWKASGDAIKVYSEHVVKIIEALPEVYHGKKELAIREFAINNSHMTYEDILNWRRLGYYNVKEFWKYRKYIKRVAEKNNLFMFLIAIAPNKIIPKLI